ncbi:hypothetical protein TNCV_1597431 [Trichonephila clavipes]|nr:hypothetical protein TNCV_1597431 [Trichonephila clavipes]
MRLYVDREMAFVEPTVVTAGIDHDMPGVFENVRWLLLIALYGSECWTLNKAHEEKRLNFERKILRKIFGPIQENNEWRILHNHENFRKYGWKDIVRTTKTSPIR